MKIKHLLIGMLAVAAAVACKQDEPVETPKLDVDKTAVQVAATAGEASFSVTTNQDWTASPDADWVSVDPATGKGSEKAVTVKVTAEDNTSEEPRTAKITVKAGELTKTVAVTQAGATNTEPGPGPEPTEDTYILVGDAVGGWDVDANGVVLTLTDGYYVAKEVGITANKGMHFTKNSSWEGNVKGLHGLIAPNEIGEVGTNDISLTEGGAFDVYLTEALDKFYFMTPGKTPEEAVEHVEIAVSWGMMGKFVDNEWVTDVPMTYEGEWIVAKGAQFSQLTFKIRGNGNWTDATNIGVAPGSEKGVVNGKISVVTAEYSKANLGGDAADIKLNGEAGTYDVYFSFDKLEVYVMEQGFKPGEKDPQNPEPVEVTYTVVGTLKDINWDNANPAGLMVKEGDYYVGKNVPFVTAKTLYNGADQIEFKVVETGTWDGYAHAQKENENYINGEIPVQAGGENIIVKGAEGNYDVYFDKANLKVWVMEAGFKPGEKEPVVPEPVEVTYTVTGTIKGTDADKKANYWNPSNEPGLMALEGDYYVAKNVEFDYDYRFSDDGTGEDYVKFKICETGTWNAYGQAEEAVNKPNTEIAVLKDSKDIYLNKSGVYDVYFDKTNGKVWVMEAGYKPGEEIARLDGYQWMGEFDDMPILFDLGIAEEGMLSIALPTMDESGFALHMVGFYEIEATDKSSGVISFTQYDWEWDEVGEEFEIQYSELTANSVKVVCENVFGVAEPITLTRVEYPYEIQLPGGGGESPEGPIADGGYWFTNSGKVMAPMAEDVTSGVFPAKDLINYASTVKNTFTFTYDPDYTAYTIQDSYGRYLGQTDWESGNATLVTELPAGEDYAYYLWVVDDSYGDGTADVYNLSTYFGIGYFADSNEWRLSEDTYTDATLRPFLVAADNPVEEPVEPEGPKVVTVAEFLAAADNDIEYQVSGTISGIYQAYNASYGNISIYISDETGEMLAYRLSCEGINDPANTITKGDLITVKGKRTLYNETPQMAQGCVIVEHTDVVIEAPEGSATLSFADTANRTVFTTSQQVWEQNGIKLTNDKGSSTSNVADYSAPARFYKNSKITVEYAGMTKIEFTCNNSSYATALESSITSGNVSVSGSVVTVTLDAASDSYVVSALSGGQVRMDSVTVYAE